MGVFVNRIRCSSFAGATILSPAPLPLPRVLPASLLLLVLLAPLGCGRGGDSSADPPSPAAGPPGAPGGARGAGAVAVEAAIVEIGSIARTITVSGVVEPIRTVGVNSRMSGAVLSVHAEEGDAVRLDQVLARLDDRELQAELDAAEAAFQVADAAYERAIQLRERQVITVPEYERERTAHAAAAARLDQVRTRLDFATVRAPLDGVITRKQIEAGDVAAAQSRLFDLADMSVMVVRVQVSELEVVHLREGHEAAIAMDAFPGRELRGRIRRVFPAADPVTRLVPVEVALEGEAVSLARPGFLARATFAPVRHNDVLLIPASAIVSSGGAEIVFVVEDGKAARRPVSTSLSWLGQVEITSGLMAGEKVVTLGNNMLRDGSAVRVVGAAQPPDRGGGTTGSDPVHAGTPAAAGEGPGR